MYIAVVWEVGDSYVVQLLFVADFGVSAKNVTERQKRDSFIGTLAPNNPELNPIDCNI